MGEIEIHITHIFIIFFSLSFFIYNVFLSGVKALRPGDKFILINVDTSSENVYAHVIMNR